MTALPFELGVNYWPRRRAMAMWRDLDLGEVKEDFAHIRDLGFGAVRFFCLTRDFMPSADRVASDHINGLVRVASLARDAGLRSVPTLVVINMSGVIWWPPWMTGDDGRPRDLFADPVLLGAQALLVEACTSALAGDDSIRAFDLSNEIDDAQHPSSRQAASHWVRLLASRARACAPGVPIRIGAHLPSLTSQRHMRVDDLGEILDEDCMHAYPLYSDVARSPLDPELVPFACALTRELAGRSRATLMQEMGVCTAHPGSPGKTIDDDFLGELRPQYLASEDEAAAYYRDVLARLIATGARGAYAWCYGDYAPELFDHEPLVRAVRERSFGLVRADGTEKPAAHVIRELASRLDSGVVTRGSAPALLDVPADEYYEDPAGHVRRLYRNWLERAPEVRAT